VFFAFLIAWWIPVLVGVYVLLKMIVWQNIQELRGDDGW
jgi:hypothetical protein